MTRLQLRRTHRTAGRLAALGLAMLLALPATGGRAEPRTLEVDLSHTSVHWAIGHGGFSKVVGTFRKIDSVSVTFDPEDVSNSSVSAVVDAASLDSNHYYRDNYTRSAVFLDVINHPTISFKSTAIEKTGENTGRMTGDLTLRGVTKPVTFEVRFNGTGPHLSGRYHIDGFEARATINRKDFGIDAFSPWVGDEVEIMIQLEGIHSRS
ncbi:MAG: polyisoprenoid-binding protein [Paracoccaceae bacterium]|nr:MAG: polyisoprenoid-binding protein [Paracoccaceae bacterium]